MSHNVPCEKMVAAKWDVNCREMGVSDGVAVKQPRLLRTNCNTQTHTQTNASNDNIRRRGVTHSSPIDSELRSICIFVPGKVIRKTYTQQKDGDMMTSLNGNIFRVTGHLYSPDL